MPFLHRAAKLAVPLVVLTATMALAAAPALADDDHKGRGRGGHGDDDAIVAVSLSDVTNRPAADWDVTATPSASEEKRVTFEIKNISLSIPHQFVVIRTSL